MNATRFFIFSILTLLAMPAYAFDEGTCVELEGKTLDGQTYDESTDEQWTIVEFWATWCTPCHTSVEEMTRLVSRHDSVRLVGINSESDLDRVREFARERSWHFTTILDPDQKWLERANPRAMPFSVLLDPDGCVVWQGVGGNEKTIQSLANVLERNNL